MRMAMLRRIDHEARRRTTRPELPERLWTPPLTRHAQTPLIQTRVVTRHRFHGDWNYTLRPHHAQGGSPTSARRRQQPAEHAPDRALLSHPDLTGMPRDQLDNMTAQLAESQSTTA